MYKRHKEDEFQQKVSTYEREQENYWSQDTSPMLSRLESFCNETRRQRGWILVKSLIAKSLILPFIIWLICYAVNANIEATIGSVGLVVVMQQNLIARRANKIAEIANAFTYQINSDTLRKRHVRMLAQQAERDDEKDEIAAEQELIDGDQSESVFSGPPLQRGPPRV